MAVDIEPDIVKAQRPFPQAQELLAGTPVSRVPNYVDVGWYDSSVDARRGAFCFAATGEHEDLVGDILRIAVAGRAIYVVCLGQRDIPTPLAVTRRAFFPQLGLLTVSSVPCLVEVVR